MGQIINRDKIGTLTHSAGNILMAASVSSPAYLTIGGLQYKVTSQLSVSVGSLTANIRYQVYAVQSAGVVSLVISSRENSQGPLGYAGWKLIGSLQANGSGAFGSFLSIKGAPISSSYEQTDASIGGGFGTVTAFKVFLRRNGNKLEMDGYWTNGTVAAALGTIALPVNLALDTNVLTRNNTTAQPGEYVGDLATEGTSNHTRIVTAPATSTTIIYNASAYSQATGITPNNANAIATTGSKSTFKATLPISSWSNVAIEDL